MSLTIRYSKRAEAQLAALFAYVAEAASPDVARTFIRDIVDACSALADFPDRGRARDDVRPGLRTLAYRRRVIIAYMRMGDALTVLGVFYGGQDFEAGLTNG